jgi:hypothetical protein
MPTDDEKQIKSSDSWLVLLLNIGRRIKKSPRETRDFDGLLFVRSHIGEMVMQSPYGLKLHFLSENRSKGKGPQSKLSF